MNKRTSPSNWTDETHPSWGKVNVFRTSGRTNLFRSSLEHNHFITLSIRRARVVDTGLANDFLADGEELIEVSMSETQFARMITSIGMGSGSACTIRRFGGKLVEEPPLEDRKVFVVESHSQNLDDQKSELSESLGRLQRMRVDKKRPTLSELEDLIMMLDRFVHNHDANKKFYREQFVEEVETIIEEAKTEIEVHLLKSSSMLGIESVEPPRLQ